jgi:predicted NAD-dependent protein-ADP-ribosyltransferase YbiA (DUF1768 family)
MILGTFKNFHTNLALMKLGTFSNFHTNPILVLGTYFFIENIIIHTRLVVLVLNPHDHHSVFLLLANIRQIST